MSALSYLIATPKHTAKFRHLDISCDKMTYILRVFKPSPSSEWNFLVFGFTLVCGLGLLTTTFRNSLSFPSRDNCNDCNFNYNWPLKMAPTRKSETSSSSANLSHTPGCRRNNMHLYDPSICHAHTPYYNINMWTRNIFSFTHNFIRIQFVDVNNEFSQTTDKHQTLATLVAVNITRCS